MIRCSQTTGRVPSEWRIAVILLYKSGYREEPLNHVPASLTSIIIKLCENVRKKKKRMEYLEESKRLIETVWF